MDNQEILDNAGYIETHLFYPWEEWINRDSRMAFSHEAKRDADSDWLREEIGKTAPAGQFVFYCGYGAEMDQQRGQSMLDRMNLGHLRADVRLVVPSR